MNTSFISDLWSQISKLRFKLQPHVQWHHHHYRQVPWYLLQDCSNNNHYHITEAGYEFIKHLDGQETIEQIQNKINEKHTLSSEDIVNLLSRLQAADLLITHDGQNYEQLFNNWQKRRRAQRLKILLSPLSLRFRLFNPSRLLDKLMPFVRPLFCWQILLLWVMFVLLASILGIMNASDLSAHAQSRFLSPTNLFLLWLVYPIIKVFHEFGHAFALRAFGKSVHEMGMMLLVFIPVPYVEASVATGLPQKYKRMIISAMGIMVELLLSALALFVWLNVQPGLIKDLAFNIMIIGGVSTLLFNGNPLLKFDGYFVFSDFLEIPNLAQRAKHFYSYLAKRYLFGMDNVASPVIAPGERFWFVIYGFSAYIYRLAISLTIALFLATHYFIIGTVLAIWSLSLQLILPLIRIFMFLISAPQLQPHRQRAVFASVSLVFLSLILLLVPKFPFNTVAQGIILLPESALIRAQSSGEVIERHHVDGEFVESGTPIVTLYDPEIFARQVTLRARIEQLQIRMNKEQLNDRTEAAIQSERLQELRKELKEVNEQITNLTVLSPSKGELELIRTKDLPGRYIEKGQIIGSIQNNNPATVRVVVPQSSIKFVRSDRTAVEMRHPGQPNQVYQGQVLTLTPSASNLLPSPSLGKSLGGLIETDARDKKGITTLEPVFQFDILISDKTDFIPGTRVFVRFKHTATPLGIRLYRATRQLLLAKLNN